MILRMNLGKKGMDPEPITFFFSFLTFIVLTLIFFLIFSMKGCSGKTFEEKIGESTTLNAEANYLITEFLRKPIDFDSNNDGTNETIAISELITWSKQHNDYGRLSDELANNFDRTEMFWDFAIYDDGGEKIFSRMREDSLSRALNSFIEKTTIPDYYDTGKPLTIRILFSEGVVYD